MRMIKAILLLAIVGMVFKDAGLAAAIFFGWLAYVVLFIG